MSRLERSSVNMLTSLAGYIFPMIISFVTTPLLLRMLGEAAYGIQNLVGVVVGYLVFMDMGLDIPITKFLAEDRARKDSVAQNHLLSTTLQLYMLVGALGMVIIMLLSDWLAKSVFQVPEHLVSQAIYVFRIAGIGFLGGVLMSWGTATMNGLQRYDVNYSVSVTLGTIGALLGLGAVYAGYGLVGYVLTRTIFTLLAGPVYFLMARHLLPDFHLCVGLHKATLRRVISYVGYGSLNRITRGVAGTIDKTLIGAWVGVAATGVYAVPFLVVQSLGFMISFALGFIFPMASELQSMGQMDQLRDIFVRASRFIAALACLVFIPLFILGDLFLALWVPSIAGRATTLLQLLSIAGFIGTLTASLTNNILIGLGGIKHFSIYCTIRSLVLGLLCAVFIWTLGMEGAGWAVLSTCFIDVIYFVLVIRSYLQFPVIHLLHSAYLKPLMLGSVLGVLAFVSRPIAESWVGLSAVGLGLTIFYCLTGYAIGVFGETEKRVVVALWNKLGIARSSKTKCD
jgi:O-antigen/teichoic acid export membrane protein